MSEGRRGRGERDDGARSGKADGSAHGQDRATAAAATTLLVALLAGCGSTTATPTAPLDPHSRPIGRGPAYHPSPGARPTAGLSCTTGGPKRYGVHLELFANRLVVIVPPGIGVAPPRIRRGAYVVGGRCSYPARTVEPTGVIQVARGSRLTLGDFFDLWGRPLGPDRLLGFRGKLRVFVAGKPWRGSPLAIPLTRHAEIALEVGGYVPPRVGYRFRPGL
jgi:hypothetical protein